MIVMSYMLILMALSKVRGDFLMIQGGQCYFKLKKNGSDVIVSLHYHVLFSIVLIQLVSDVADITTLLHACVGLLACDRV